MKQLQQYPTPEANQAALECGFATNLYVPKSRMEDMERRYAACRREMLEIAYDNKHLIGRIDRILTLTAPKQ